MLLCMLVFLYQQTMHGDKIKSKHNLDGLVKEIVNLNTLTHPKIVKFYGILWPSQSFPGMASS